MKRNQKTKKQRRLELIRFGEYMISGGAYFWSGYIVFFVCSHFLGWDLWWASLTANLTGWTINYLLQRYWVFNNKRLKHHQTQVTIRYIMITAVNFLLNYLILASLKSVGITPYLGQFASAAFFTGWNYFWYRFWVFPEHKHHHKRVATV